MTRQRALAKPETRKRAPAEDLERLTDLLTGVLKQSGYIHSTGADAKIRRLIRRLDLPAHDVEVWLGMIRQIHWKLTRE